MYVIYLLVAVSGYQYAEDEEARRHTEYGAGYEGVATGPLGLQNVETAVRMRRFPNNRELRTLSPEEIEDVKGALKKILAGSGHEVDNLFTPQANLSSTNMATTNMAAYVIDTEDKDYNDATDKSNDQFADGSTDKSTVGVKPTHTPGSVEKWRKIGRSGELVNTSQIQITDPPTKTSRQIWNVTTKKRKKGKGRRKNRTSTTPMTTLTTTVTTTASPLLDIPALLDIVANLTYQWEINLTEMVNETLQKYKIPTCPTAPPTTTTTATTSFGYDYEGNLTGTIMGKCFVCGLEVEGIPRNAYCADAFAGDFLPLVPVDPTARGQIAMYRKYCRYMDVSHYHYNESDPRSLWGRWTGGCSVRWIDLSGVYTQRSCRNRHKALMGRHFASKRMAKLEMALQHLDNGCIISPMATLVPLSRGISLYARFHACVCTGSWCNRACVGAQWTTCNAILRVYYVGLCLDLLWANLL